MEGANMLKTYKEKLIRDYETEKENLNQFLGDEKPKFLDKSAMEAVRNFIVDMPDIIQDINTMIRTRVSPPQLDIAFGFMVSYVLDPQDILPEATFGFFGHLDDAYVTGRVLEWAMEFIDVEKIKEIGLDPDILDDYIALKKRTKGFLPPQILESLDIVLDNIFKGAELFLKNVDLKDLESRFVGINKEK